MDAPMEDCLASSTSSSGSEGACGAVSDISTEWLATVPQLKRSCSDGSLSPSCGRAGQRQRRDDPEFRELRTLTAFQQLSPAQRSIIHRIASVLDSKQDSIVVTNPRQPDGSACARLERCPALAGGSVLPWIATRGAATAAPPA